MELKKKKQGLNTSMMGDGMTGEPPAPHYIHFQSNKNVHLLFRMLWRPSTFSQDTPDFFKSRANLCTGQCRRKRVITDGHSLLRVVYVHLKKERELSIASEMLAVIPQKVVSSPLHAQTLRSPLQPDLLALRSEGRRLLQRRTRCLCVGSPEAGGQTQGS